MCYPAGHAWLFTLLYSITGGGVDTRLAQYLALAVYIANLALVFRLMVRTERMPPYLLAVMSLGGIRVKIVTITMLFNDPVAMLLVHAALNMFIDSHWSLGSLLFSLGVSVKMNVLLFSPALLLVYLACLGVGKTIKQLTICASTQLILALSLIHI